MNRDELRAYFKSKGLTYSDICIEELRMLELILNKQFNAQHIERFKSNNNAYWVRVNPAKYYKGQYNPNGRLICAYITAKGGYFSAREVISFNPDGFIGFCGEADSSNLIPVANAFVEWCDYVVKTIEGGAHDPL